MALGNAVVPQVSELVGDYIASSVDGYQPQGWRPASEPGASGAMRGGRLYDAPPVATLREALDRHAAWLAAAPGRGGQTPLEVLVLRLARGQSTLIPTPTSGDAAASGSRCTPQSNAVPGVSLTDRVRGDGGRGRGEPLLPTPCATEYGSNGGGSEWLKHGRRIKPGRPSLQGVVRDALLPTPVASMHRSGHASEATHERNARPLHETVGGDEGGAGGSFLNPRWVEWLMGFPVGWTG